MPHDSVAGASEFVTWPCSCKVAAGLFFWNLPKTGLNPRSGPVFVGPRITDGSPSGDSTVGLIQDSKCFEK